MYLIVKFRTLLILMGAALILAASPTLIRAADDGPAAQVSGSSSSWGLSFQQEGEKPVGSATPEQLLEQNAYYVGGGDEKVIYLTFDAGYENGYTPAILDALKKHSAPACFFLVGNYLETQPELVRRMVDEGHLVGNHSYHHPDMSAIESMESFRLELESLEELYTQVTGGDMPKLYRPPRGIYSRSNLEMAKELGYTTVLWSLAYVDWYVDDQPTPEQAFSKLIPRIHPGAVVLLHSTSATNAQILDELLTRWEELGYRFGSLDELTKDAAA